MSCALLGSLVAAPQLPHQHGDGLRHSSAALSLAAAAAGGSSRPAAAGRQRQAGRQGDTDRVILGDRTRRALSLPTSTPCMALACFPLSESERGRGWPAVRGFRQQGRGVPLQLPRWASLAAARLGDRRALGAVGRWANNYNDTARLRGPGRTRALREKRGAARGAWISGRGVCVWERGGGREGGDELRDVRGDRSRGLRSPGEVPPGFEPGPLFLLVEPATQPTLDIVVRSAPPPQGQIPLHLDLGCGTRSLGADTRGIRIDY
jgi:hypothetical protein